MVFGVAPRNQTPRLSSPRGCVKGQAELRLSSRTWGLWVRCCLDRVGVLTLHRPPQGGSPHALLCDKGSVKSSSVPAFYEDILCLSKIKGNRGQEKALPFILSARMLASESARMSPAGRVCAASLRAGAEPATDRGRVSSRLLPVSAAWPPFVCLLQWEGCSRYWLVKFMTREVPWLL